MNQETFEKLDRAFTDRFRAVREKKVSSQVLERFSASVERRILEKQTEKSLRPGWAFLRWAPVWVPAFAVTVLVISTAVLQSPGGLKSVLSKTNPVLSLHVSVSSEISEEVVLLQDLEEWSEDDEAEFN